MQYVVNLKMQVWWWRLTDESIVGEGEGSHPTECKEKKGLWRNPIKQNNRFMYSYEDRDTKIEIKQNEMRWFEHCNIGL